MVRVDSWVDGHICGGVIGVPCGIGIVEDKMLSGSHSRASTYQ